MLPEVLLIGDSIRAGYQPFVEEALRGSAVRANLDGWLRVRGVTIWSI